MRRRGRAALAIGAVALAGGLVLLAGSASGAATANVDSYALSGTEAIPELSVCLSYSLSGVLHYTATPLRRLPPIASHRIGVVSMADPTVAVAAVAYDPKQRVCTRLPIRWRELSVRQVWTGLEPGSGLEATSYGPNSSATQYNSGLTPTFGSVFYTNLTRGRPPCFQVAVDLRVTVGDAESARRTAPLAVCLTPEYQE